MKNKMDYKEKKKYIKEIFSKINFENILMLFIIIQPIVDILTSLSIEYVSEKLTIGIFIRTIFMGYVVIYSIIMAKENRKKILIYYGLIAIYFLATLLKYYFKFGTTMILIQIKGFIKTFYFPIILSSLLVIYKNKKYETKQGYMKLAMYIFVLSIVFCKLLNLGFPTYPWGEKVGTKGLFYAGNEIGGVLSILAPFVFLIFIFDKFNIENILLCIFSIFAMLELGTKVATLSICLLCIISFALCILLIFRKNGKKYIKKSITLFLICVFFIVALPKTSGGENLNIKSFISFKKSELKQENVVTEEPIDNTTIKQIKEQEIEKFNKELVSISGREVFYKDRLNEYKDSTVLSKLFGLGYVSSLNGEIVESKLVEIDYIDIAFNHGIIGFLIIIIPLLVVIVDSIKEFFSNFKNNILDFKLILILYSVLIGFGISMIAGHVITAPAVSIFLNLSLMEMLEHLKANRELKNE